MFVDVFMTLTPALIKRGVDITAVIAALHPWSPFLLREGKSNCADHRLLYHIRLHAPTFPPTIKVNKTTCKLSRLRRQDPPWSYFVSPCGYFALGYI
jgi:hypothetical protein